jgi:hypothetical protein
MSRLPHHLLLLALLAAPTAAQDTRRLDVARFRPAPDRDGFLGISGTRTPGPGAWNTAFVLAYGLEPLSVTGLDGREPVLRHRVQADLLVQLGLGGRVAVLAQLPLLLFQDGDPAALGETTPIATAAFRDPLLELRARVLGEEADGEGGRHEGEGLGLRAAVHLPLGTEDQFAGEGAPRLEGAVLADFHFLDFGFGAEVGYRHRFAEPTLLGVLFRNELFFGGALQVPTIVVPNLSALVEVRVVTALDVEAFRAESSTVEGDLGVRWSDGGDVALTAAVGVGFYGGPGTPAFRGVVGVDFAPRSRDYDGDGLGPDEDGCAYLPEDFDGYEDDDGCPDLDDDGDQVPDVDDRCPREAAEAPDADQDGCTDPPRDTDRDGIADADDGCPGAPEDRDGVEDGDGCPDLDDDGDFVFDPHDRCPDEPEDEDGFEDDDGCPEPDPPRAEESDRADSLP